MMRRATTPRVLSLAVMLSVTGCNFYAPTFADCAVQCGDGGACPAETTCVDGFCRAPGREQACECTPGTTRHCGSAKGECATGRQTCSPLGRWETVCLGEGHPSEEFCDGKDNDCDGVVDDHLVDDVACPLTAGVCAGSHMACVDGGHVACTTETYGPSYEVAEQACDGLDNDCDGNTDFTPPVQWMGSAYNHWALVGTDAGFTLVYTKDQFSTHQEGLYAQRFDRRLAPVGGAVEVRAGSGALVAAARAGDDVVVSWGAANEVGMARIDPSDTVHLGQRVFDAGFVDALHLGAGQEVAAIFRADNGYAARLVRWGADGGVVAVTDLHRLDGGTKVIDVLEVNISNDGRSVAYDGNSNPDAGLPFRFWFFIFDVKTLSPLREFVYFGGPNGKLLTQPGGHLTATFPYGVFGNNQVGVYFNADLLDSNLQEAPIVASMSDANAFGRSDATLDAKGDVGVVYAMPTAHQLGLAHSSRLGALETFATTTLPPDAGYGLPAIAASGTQPMLGVVDANPGGLTARLVCLP